MKLQNLLKNFILIECPDVNVTGLQIDSRKIKVGDLFFAYQGFVEDGRRFIAQAIQQGAAAVLKEAVSEDDVITFQDNIPIIAIKNLPQKISAIAAFFYGNHQHELHSIGVTGTNGKTSCVQLLSGILQHFHHRCGTIGTIGYGVNGQLQSLDRTTPDAVTIQRAIADFIKQQADTLVMEVSSHALSQHRVADIPFDLGIFTNLTQDHLDYHSTMEHYAATKKTLFDIPSLRCAVFNCDDAVGHRWAHEYQNQLSVCGYTLNPSAIKATVPLVYAENITLNENGVEARIITPWGDGFLKTQLLGSFNLSNLLAVIAALGLLDYALEDILKIIPSLQTVKGRMEKIQLKNSPTVIIDYAHTPDALEQALKAVREHCSGRLFCVFGCGGNRDSSKRSVMGATAEKYADQLIVTDDNPRFEDSAEIIQDILQGIQDHNCVYVESDRRLAIKKAFEQAQINDMILLAGKGHETYQVIKGQKNPMDERKIIEELMPCYCG